MAKRRWGAMGKSITPPTPPTDAGLDYMSDAFLAGNGTDGGQGGKRGKRLAPPSPPPTLKSKAEIHQEASEKLQTALSQPLPEDNRGLKLLRLMGYKEGKGLGKSIEGIKEPLRIEVATQRRSGLGVVQEQRERRQQQGARRAELRELRAQYVEEQRQSFKQSMSSRFTEKRVRAQLLRARKTVETLDSRSGRERSFLWPGGEDDGQQHEEEEPAHWHQRHHQPADQPPALIKGPTEEQGAAEEDGGVDEEEAAAQEEEEEQAAVWRVMPEADKLSTVLEYLRHEHHYCLFCGHQYASAEELKAECPGISEDDH